MFDPVENCKNLKSYKDMVPASAHHGWMMGTDRERRGRETGLGCGVGEGPGRIWMEKKGKEEDVEIYGGGLGARKDANDWARGCLIWEKPYLC